MKRTAILPALLAAGSQGPERVTDIAPTSNLAVDPAPDADGLLRVLVMHDFTSNQTGRYEIWKIRVDGTGSKQLTRTGGTEAFEWSDGRTLPYKQGDTLGDFPVVEMPIDGGSARPVLPAVPLLSYAPAGSDIVYVKRIGSGPRFVNEVRRDLMLIENFR